MPKTRRITRTIREEIVEEDVSQKEKQSKKKRTRSNSDEIAEDTPPEDSPAEEMVNQSDLQGKKKQQKRNVSACKKVTKAPTNNVTKAPTKIVTKPPTEKTSKSMKKLSKEVPISDNEEEEEEEVEDVKKAPKHPYRSSIKAPYTIVKAIKKDGLEFSERQLRLIKAAPYGNFFLMFLFTNGLFKEEHWLRKEEAITRLLRCYRGSKVPQHLEFEFNRHGEKKVITSTPREMAAVLGMGRMDGTVTKDNKLMGGGRWRNTDFFRRYFPKATGKKNASRTMIQDAILAILKRNKKQMKKMKKVVEENEESDESEDIEETEEIEDNKETDESEDCDENEDDEDLVRLIGLFLCTAFFFTTKEADKLSEKYIGLVSDLERSRNVSWPDLIHNFLEEQLNKHLIWFAEHTHIVKPVNIRNKKEYIPRAARWNLTAICDALLKDMDTLEFEFFTSFKDEYTRKEIDVVRSVTQSQSADKEIEEENDRQFEAKYDNLRGIIYDKWHDLQYLKKTNEPIDPSKIERYLKDIYLKAWHLNAITEEIHQRSSLEILADLAATEEIPAGHY